MQTITLRIIAKNENHNGYSAGVKFTNGVAELSHSDLKQSAKEYFLEKGYEIQGLETAEVKTTKKAKK